MKKLLPLFTLFALMILINSCKKSDLPRLSLNRTSLILDCGQKFTLEAKGEPNATFTSKDKRIASVDANGVVKANIVGKTKILVSANGKTSECNVKVNYSSDGSLVPPIEKWGASREEIKSIYSKINASDILKDNNEVFLFNMNLSLLGNYIYGYNFKDNKLISIIIAPGSRDFYASITEFKRIMQFFIETYDILGKYNDKIICQSLDGNTAAAIDLKGNNKMLILIPYKDYKKE